MVLSVADGESMLLALSEGLSSGCSIMATDVGTVRRMLGKQGDVVPPRRPGPLGRSADVDALHRNWHAWAATERRSYVAQRSDIQTTTISWMHAVLNRSPVAGDKKTTEYYKS